MPGSVELEERLQTREISAALDRLGLRPTRGKGQNFLVSQTVVNRIVDTLNPAPEEVVIEVGPGLGILTAELLKRSGWVTAIELDGRLAEHLQRTILDQRLRVVSGDALTVDLNEIIPADREYLFAANLPYSVGTAIVRRFIELTHAPRRSVIMVQKEVAERMAAVPPDMSILGVAVQLYCEVTVVFEVPSSAFKPRPKVMSSVVRLDRRAVPLLDQDECEPFFRVVHAGFSQKRKQLVNTLSQAFGLPKLRVAEWLASCDIRPEQRAETLSLESWLDLYRSIPER